MKKLLAATTACALALSTIAASAAECSNTAWKRVMSSGTLNVGVKADYKPFGFRNTDGKLVGFEPDMARQVAETMGVKLHLEPVVASNRMQFLEQGKIDLMIATMSDTKDRRNIVGIVSPDYYSSGTNILAPKALNFTSWDQLKGKPVCGVQGAFYNKQIEDKYGAKIVAFGGASEAKQALKDKKCVAFVYDDSSIVATLATDGWSDFDMPLKTEDSTPWGLAVAKDERNCIFGRFMSGMVYNWLQTGWLIKDAEKWNIKPSEYLAAQQKRFSDPLEQ